MDPPITSPHSPSGELTIAIEWFLVGIITILILARLYLRLRIRRQKITPSDVLVCLAFCSTIASLSFDTVLYRMKVLSKDVDPFLHGFKGDKKTIQKALLLFWAGNAPFFTSFYLTKAALLAFYWQVIPAVLKTSRRMLYATIAYCVLAYTTTMLLNFFLCFPIERNWVLGPNTCIYEPGTVFKTAWALNIFGDLIIFILPFTFLHILNIRGAVRVGVYCTFGLGVINIAFSLTRFLSIRLAPRNGKGTISITIITLWSCLDLCIGLIIANLPSLTPYLRLACGPTAEPAEPHHHHPPLPVRKGTLDKYRDKIWPRFDEESGSTTLQSNNEWASDGTKRTLTSSFEEAGVIPSASGSAVRSGIEMDDKVEGKSGEGK